MQKIIRIITAKQGLQGLFFPILPARQTLERGDFSRIRLARHVLRAARSLPRIFCVSLPSYHHHLRDHGDKEATQADAET